jgi:hypothetical protein
MFKSQVLFKAAIALGLVCASVAHSAPVSGTFSGIASGSRIDAMSPHPSNFDGATVTGTFWLDTSSLPPPYEQDATSSFTIFSPLLMKLTFSVPGQATVAFNGSDGENALYLTNDSTGQVTWLLPDFSYPYWHAVLYLAGPLFDGVDPKTLRPGPVDLSESWANFFAGRNFGGSLDLTSVQFDAASEVPEPETLGLLMAGLGLLAWMRRRVGQRR